MNKRLEEQLAMLAFGDLGPEETARLQQQVAGDPDATLMLEKYRGMRTGLRAMADVPEHQLSTERLRHAILNQGMKPQKRKLQLGWLWMPAMAGVIAFGLVFAKNRNHSELAGRLGAGNLNYDLSHVAAMTPFKSPEISARVSFVGAKASGAGLSDARNNDAQVALLSTESKRRSERDARVAALEEEVNEQFQNEMLAASSFSEGSGAKPVAKTSAPSGAPIVLIGNETDSSTGAQKATEVDSASNVVVGG